MHSWKRALGLAALLLAIPGALHAERVAILGSRDNTLVESDSGHLSNGSGPHFRAGRTGQPMGASIRRGLVAFDLADAIPAGSEIVDVMLILRMSASNAGPLTVTLHRTLADWGEGASSFAGGQGAPSEPGDATWIHRFFDAELWDTPGGDFTVSPSSSATVGGIGSYVWNDPAMTVDVQLWLDLPASNHGWLLLGDETASNSVKRFDAREIGSPGIPPLLLVEFTAPPTDGGDDESDDESDDEADDESSDATDEHSLRRLMPTGSRGFTLERR